MVTINPTAIRQNHDQTVSTTAGDFLVEQRNGGFATNDGWWIAELLPRNVWRTGVLRQARPGRFIGAYPTAAICEAAIAAAEPEQDHPYPIMIR